MSLVNVVMSCQGWHLPSGLCTILIVWSCAKRRENLKSMIRKRIIIDIHCLYLDIGIMAFIVDAIINKIVASNVQKHGLSVFAVFSAPGRSRHLNISNQPTMSRGHHLKNSGPLSAIKRSSKECPALCLW